MMFKSLLILFLILKCILSKPSIITYPTIDLKENIPLNSFVMKLNSSFSNSKLVLLNLMGFESNLFVIINGSSIYTKDLIDREEFIEKKYCLDNLYCKIELHIVVNDGLTYWIIPIHIVDENDNKPEFLSKEIELKYRENVLNGYKIAFEGAKDIDEGENSRIDYILDCSNNYSKRFVNQSLLSINCFPLFELIIISQTINQYSKLALKFIPSFLENIQNQYQFKIYAINLNNSNYQLENSMNLNIKIEKKEENKKLKFSLKEYEFIKLINSSSSSSSSSFINNENILGKVYASENDPSKLISYEILNKTLKTLIKINSLTGELILLNNSLIKIKNQIQFIVQASSTSNSSIKLKCLTKVKIYFRYFEYLKNLSFKFNLISKEIKQINNSKSFYLNKNIEINEILLKFSFYSFNYPNDEFIVSLNNHLNIFSLISSFNTYLLKLNQNLISKSIYLLNIRIKHKLSQQWLPNLKIELIIIDQSTTTTTITIQDEILSSTKESFKINNEFCIENKSYILNEINSNDQIGLLRVIKSNLNLNLNESFVSFINESKIIIINKCQMFIEELNYLINNSLKYELCYFYNDNQCFNLTLINSSTLIKTNINYSKKESSSFSIKSIQIIIFIISILFILITFILIFIICQLKGVFIRNYLFIQNKYRNNQHLPANKLERVHSIVIQKSHSSSFQSMRIKNEIDEPYVYNIHDLVEQEALPSSSNIFILPSSPPLSLSSRSSLTYSIRRDENQVIPTYRTCSSSSFLQETKQLLELISTNQNTDSSKLASEV